MDIETYHLSHPQLIKKIVSDLGLSKYDKSPRTTPSLTTNIMGTFQDAEKPTNTSTIAVS